MIASFRTVSSVALLALLASCNGGDGTPVEPRPDPEERRPTTLGVSPDSVVLRAVGDTARFTATVRDQQGRAMDTVLVSWASLDTTVATVGHAGLVTARTAGQVVIRAAAGSLRAERKARVELPIEPPRPTALELSPDSLVLGVDGDTARFLAVVKDQSGQAMTGLSVAWSSSDTATARVDAAGLVTSRRAGRATIRATVEALQAERPVVVKLQMNAQCRVPSAFPSRGPVGGIPRFVEEFRLDSLRATYGEDVQGAVVDLGNDGREDVLVFSNNRSPGALAGFRNAIQVWRNDGSGRFVDATASVLGSDSVPVDGPPNSRVLDINGDGLQDVFATQAGWDYPPGPGGPDLLLLQRPGGRLVDLASDALNPYERRGSGAFTHSGAAADIDCDGDVDLYQGNINHPVGPHLQVNTGGLVFRADEQQRLPEFVWRLREKFTTAEFCDVNRDGDVDLVLGGFDGSRDRLLVNDGFGRFTPAAESALPPPHFAVGRSITIDLRCGDVDLDGWNDLMVSSNDAYRQPRISFWRNRQDGTFEDRTSTHLPQSWPGSELENVWVDEFHLVDLNRDGWLDMVGSSICVGAVFINRGEGRFAQVADLLPARSVCTRPGDSVHLLLPLDADGDGWTDLLLLRGAEHHTLMSTRGAERIGVSSILRNLR
jgi:hypothetical protein